MERAQETERILGILHQWGIHTLGQLAALSPDDLAGRLGARAVELWQRANGKAERILNLVAPPESFLESFEFENEIETVEPLLFILRRFLQQLATRLRVIYLVSGELRLRLTFSDKTNYEHIFKIPQPTNSEEILFRMLYTHLENFTAPDPIVAVELEATPTRSVRQQFGLFETALRDPAQLYETLARLVGLFGEEQVGTPVLEATHRPDAFRMAPFVWELGPFERCEPKALPLRFNSGSCDTALDDRRIPLRRLRKRAPATVLLDNDKPAHLRTTEAEGVITTQAGPFTLSGHWWDEHAWARVEWDVEMENGMVARCHWDKKGWALDGIYD